MIGDDIVERYVEFAEDHYEIEADRTAVEHVVARLPLTDPVVRALNPQATLTRLHADLTVIGYPIRHAVINPVLIDFEAAPPPDPSRCASECVTATAPAPSIETAGKRARGGRFRALRGLADAFGQRDGDPFRPRT